MGDSCLMQPFSYVSGPPTDPIQAHSIHSLGQSVSFGRFVSDSMSWEKWSVFSHNNRYVEEAEKYSRPGSVAQKKAFFEAHYKRMAERKAAALLEQANAASNGARETDSDAQINSSDMEGSAREPALEARCNDEANSTDNEAHESGFTCRTVSSNIEPSRQEMQIEVQCNVAGPKSRGHELNPEVRMEETKSEVEDKEVILENVTESDEQHDNFEDEQKVASETEDNRTPEMERPLLKQNLVDQKVSVCETSRKKAALFASKLLSCNRAPKHQQSPSSAKPVTPIHFRKEIYATPTGKKLPLDLSDKKKTTPKRVTSSQVTPTRDGSRVNSTFVTRKIGSSRTVGSSSIPTAAKDCATPSVTPSMILANGTSRNTLATPQSTNRRTPCDRSAAESKSAGPKRRSLATDWSKFLNSCKSKLQSPSLSTPFRLKTEERATKRKEKLEEKFNADEAHKQKVQEQAKLKEKAELDLKKFRQSLCFKARPLPDFYKEKSATKTSPKKVPFPSTFSSQPGRKPKATAMQQTDPLPQKISVRTNQSKNIQGRSSHIPTGSRDSKPYMSTLENTSPNIQHL